jgi:hypothetical protein
MGTLDAFVARGDAQDKFDAFKDQNSGFKDNLKNAASGVNASIAQAKASGQQNYDAVMNAIGARIKAISGEQETRAGAANREAEAQAAAARGLTFGQNEEFQRSTTTDPFVTRVAGSDVATQAELDALNALGGMDDDVSTGGYSKGSKTAGFDFKGYQKAVENEFADWSKTRPQATPTTPTAGGTDILSQILGKALGAKSEASPVSAADSGTGSAAEQRITTYPDGSYTVKGPQGEIIQYNPDGTIKKTSGTNIFT